MKLKSYFAGTVEAAMRLARQELGDDALLMNSRRAPAEARHLGLYEVVFATESTAGEPAPSPPSATSSDKSLPLSGEVAQLRLELERVASVIERSHLRPGRFHPWLDEVCAELLAADLSPGLAYETARALEGCGLDGDPDRTQTELRRVLESRFTVGTGLEIPPNGEERRRRVIALIGPPGAGKTTTLVKLATRYSLAARRPSRLVSMDTHRVGGADQLRTFAGILGIGFDAVDTVGGLSQVLEENARKELVWIDTPGYSRGDLDLGADLAHFLAGYPFIETHLVLSCRCKPADLTRVVDSFSAFRPSRLLFTQLDETLTYGSIVSESARTGLPVSFLACGQKIPEDLEIAAKSRILELTLRAPGWELRPAFRRGPARTSETGSGGRMESEEAVAGGYGVRRATAG